MLFLLMQELTLFSTSISVNLARIDYLPFSTLSSLEFAAPPKCLTQHSQSTNVEID